MLVGGGRLTAILKRHSQVAGMVSRELEAESVVVFDEAHNIDNVCTEALSVDLDKRSLEAASRCLGKISSKVHTHMHIHT